MNAKKQKLKNLNPYGRSASSATSMICLTLTEFLKQCLGYPPTNHRLHVTDRGWIHGGSRKQRDIPEIWEQLRKEFRDGARARVDGGADPQRQ
jgi:hypothetical protein